VKHTGSLVSNKLNLAYVSQKGVQGHHRIKN